MLNSIQNRSNVRPAFGCSTKRECRLAIADLVSHGIKEADAAEHFDHFAPQSGKVLLDNLGASVLIPHGTLMELADKQARNLLRILSK